MNISLKMLTKMAATISLSMLLIIDAHAAESEKLSFKPFQTCKMPPKSPPKKLLDKVYKVYIGPGDWHKVDINGDGWCDWVRDGYEGYQTDQDEPRLREFIYLGTPTGWRKFGTSKAYKEIERNELQGSIKGLMEPYAPAFDFFQPVVIYSNKVNAPYVVTMSSRDARGPFPRINELYVMNWDDTFDMLRSVDEKDRQKIIEFMRIEVCNNPKAPLNHGSLYTSINDFCPAK